MENNQPSAYIQVSVFANEHHSGYAELTQEITRLIHKTLSIAPERIILLIKPPNSPKAQKRINFFTVYVMPPLSSNEKPIEQRKFLQLPAGGS